MRTKGDKNRATRRRKKIEKRRNRITVRGNSPYNYVDNPDYASLSTVEKIFIVQYVFGEELEDAIKIVLTDIIEGIK